MKVIKTCKSEKEWFDDWDQILLSHSLKKTFVIVMNIVIIFTSYSTEYERKGKSSTSF